MKTFALDVNLYFLSKKMLCHVFDMTRPANFCSRWIVNCELKLNCDFIVFVNLFVFFILMFRIHLCFPFSSSIFSSYFWIWQVIIRNSATTPLIVVGNPSFWKSRRCQSDVPKVTKTSQSDVPKVTTPLIVVGNPSFWKSRRISLLLPLAFSSLPAPAVCLFCAQ